MLNRSQERKSPFRRVKPEEIPVCNKFADNSFEAKVSLFSVMQKMTKNNELRLGLT